MAVVNHDILIKLKDFGLNTYESRLWVALLSKGNATAGKLSDIANVPRSRTYDVLESLERKGFVLMKLGKPITYFAVPPEEVLERVKKKIKEEAQERETLISELKKSNIFNELNNLHDNGLTFVEANELSGFVRGRTSINNHIYTMIRSAEKSVNLITSSDDLKDKADFIKSLDKTKKIKFKILVNGKEIEKSTLDKLKTLSEIKNTKIKSRIYVIDNKQVLFSLLDDKTTHPSYDLAVWLNSDFFAQSLEEMFDEVWNSTNHL